MDPVRLDDFCVKNGQRYVNSEKKAEGYPARIHVAASVRFGLRLAQF